MGVYSGKGPWVLLGYTCHVTLAASPQPPAPHRLFPISSQPPLGTQAGNLLLSLLLLTPRNQ